MQQQRAQKAHSALHGALVLAITEDPVTDPVEKTLGYLITPAVTNEMLATPNGTSPATLTGQLPTPHVGYCWSPSSSISQKRSGIGSSQKLNINYPLLNTRLIQDRDPKVHNRRPPSQTLQTLPCSVLDLVHGALRPAPAGISQCQNLR